VSERAVRIHPARWLENETAPILLPHFGYGNDNGLGLGNAKEQRNTF